MPEPEKNMIVRKPSVARLFIFVIANKVKQSVKKEKITSSLNGIRNDIPIIISTQKTQY